MANVRRPEVSLYRRNAAFITTRTVLHAAEKEAEIAELSPFKRKKGRVELEAKWRDEERAAVAEAKPVVGAVIDSAEQLVASFKRLEELSIPELRGKVEAEIIRTERARTSLLAAKEALAEFDFGTAGASVNEAMRELWLVGGPLVVALNQALSQAAIGKEQRQTLSRNVTARQAAKSALEAARHKGHGEAMTATAAVHVLEAEGYGLAADILSSQVKKTSAPTKSKVGRENSLRVIPPQELETFSDVGGLDEVKQQLRSTIGAILERPDEAAKYHVVHNGILFHGPPGTGKTLLSRALAGEYGLRYIRFNPASIASAYIHEAASNLQRLFELARENTPCVLFLDEVDTIASARDDQPSADHREVVTQLMNSLEEYRTVQGLVIVAATNNVDRLDPGLREGRFDAKILVPLPDPEARKEVVRVHLERRGDAVDWSEIDLDAIAGLTSGRNAAALEGYVSLASQNALQTGAPITHASLEDAIRQREGKDRLSLEEPVTWDDVVLPDRTQEQVREILNVFSHPELARSLGVRAPAGILLYGPPGTGKTTIARAMATEVSASFYDQSAADILSKWAGESEERVVKLFAKARANRPSIIFIDEIDGLLRQRSGETSTPWEERVVSQFLRELDGLGQSEGVLLVGATNRLDIIDPAIQGRRLTPIEVGLPDGAGRLKLLKVLCKDVTLADDVDLKTIATSTEGMSGADLKRLRDSAGMKALSRAAGAGTNGLTAAEITMADLMAAIDALRNRASLIQV